MIPIEKLRESICKNFFLYCEAFEHPFFNIAKEEVSGVYFDVFKNKYWYKNGKIHRLDGPAIEYVDGAKAWFQNGNLHRENGPAFEYANGNKEWWIDGIIKVKRYSNHRRPEIYKQYPY